MILSSRLMAVGRGGRTLMGPLLVINLVVCLIVLGLAGWSLDKYIDGEQNHPLTPLNQKRLKKCNYSDSNVCHSILAKVWRPPQATSLAHQRPPSALLTSLGGGIFIGTSDG
uniref:Uncharacterized protein n=1 Tax=Solanum lycopersicum TaxID=4081 RepID=A0A3Q7F7P1_SOLLC